MKSHTEDPATCFNLDGVVAVRSLLSEELRFILVAAIEDALKAAVPHVLDKAGRRFSVDGGLWMKDDRLVDVISRSGVIHLASRLLGSSKLNLLDDQIFVKEAGSASPTPWHHDITFWPFAGRQLLSVWVALDSVCTKSGGLLFARRSHRWNRLFEARGVFEDSSMLDPAHERAPDVPMADTVEFRLEAGDALVFDARTLHSAGANCSNRNRRAYVTRWSGDDVVYAPRKYASPRHLARAQAMGLVPGRPIDSPGYPVVWEAPSETIP